MKARKIVNSVLVLAFIATVLGAGAVLVRKADQRMAEYIRLITHSTGTESVTTYSFDDGELIGRVSALGVGADDGAQHRLQGSFKASLVNRRSRPLRIRGMQAVTRGTGEALSEFRFSFEKTQVPAGQQYMFAGAVPVSSEFFNRIIRKYDVALRVTTDIGAILLPVEIYTLEVEPALAAGLLSTNQVSFGEAEGIINFLTCEQSSPEQLCEQVLKRMGAP